MMHWIIATALTLQSADTARIPARTMLAPPLAHVDLAADKQRAAPAFGDDKVQHFFLSYSVYSFAYAGGRAVGLNRKPALVDAFGAVVAIGLGKELFDRKAGKPFSGFDLVADVLGGVAAYALMKQAR